MNLGEIQNEIVAFRSNSTQVGAITHCVNLRYLRIWGAAIWPFRVRTADVNVVGGTQTVTLPDDCGRVLAVFDDTGMMLPPLAQKQFWATYKAGVISNQSSPPGEWTVFNNILYLGPLPNATSTFSIVYAGRVRHFTGTNADVVGILADTDDYPYFPEEYHYMLVLGGMSTFLKLENDPTFAPLEDEFHEMLALMQSDLLPDIPEQQYGALYAG